jgi:hypothetical protein
MLPADPTSTKATTTPLTLSANLPPKAPVQPVSLPQNQPTSPVSSQPAATQGISASIAQAQKMGASPDQILQEIQKQNPTKAPVIQQAQKLGANSQQILDEIAKQNSAPSQPNVIQTLVSQTNDHAANITQDFSEKPGLPGAADVIGNVGGEVGDLLSPILKAAYEVTTPKPVKMAFSALGDVAANASQPVLRAATDAWGKLQVQHPDLAKILSNVPNIAMLFGGEEASPTVDQTINAGKTLASGLKDTASEIASSAKSAVAPDGTDEAIANIAKQEGGIVPPAKTAAQRAAETQAKTWEVIKPKLSTSDLSDAAANGKIVRTGETGVVTQIPKGQDLADIKLAQPYVEAANSDPLQTAANIKQGIATEAGKLREAVGVQGGTFSRSNIQGVLDKVPVPLAIKNTAEMTAVNNIKGYVVNLADEVDKNAAGALDLSQKFRSGINNEFGENIWGKNTPIGNYIKKVNQALNDFISTRLPDGRLPDGTLIKDSFAKQTRLYQILENIQIPKVGDALINPTEEAPLKLPGSPLSEKVKQFSKENPFISATTKAAAKAAGIAFTKK